MVSIVILIFVIGYLLITIDNPLRLDKTVPALIMAALIWKVLAIGYISGCVNVVNGEGHIFNFITGSEVAMGDFEGTHHHHLGKTAEILVFLIIAMTIVEINDLHRGFDVLKNAVTTKI